MPVYKFKSFEEAHRALWNFSPDKNYYSRIRGLFRLAYHLLPPKPRPGIHKYRTLEEAHKDRQNKF